MTKLYSEVSQETVSHLKEQGYTSVELVLLDVGNPYQATIEMIPGRAEGFRLDVISLYSSELNDYLDGNSPMATYMIDPENLEVI